MAKAQTPSAAGPSSTPAVTPAALPAPAGAAAGRPATCSIPPGMARFDRSLPRLAARIVAGKPIRIVAIGSSSTFGAGASTPAASYPSQLEIELHKHFPGHAITVINRGVNGEEVPDMLARFASGVIAEKPDLVIWQVGTNSVLRDHPLQPHVSLLHGGIEQIKATGADIVLVDPQFAPRVIAKANAAAMVELIATIAKEEKVPLFQRFVLMRHWYEVDRLPFDAFLSPDELHMNDWSYACVARLLAAAIAEAAQRPTETASAPAPRASR